MIDHSEYLNKLGITTLKPMQHDALKTIKEKGHFLLLSPTGSGKTLAFLLPVLSMLKPNVDKVQALILTPSRELALQIEKVFKTMQTGFKVNTCYGGHPITTELNNLTVPPALLIGTPGRIADHLRRDSFDTSKIRILVLDEFDKSLELGFKDEMEYIITSLTSVSAKILTSATNMVEMPDFVGLKNPIVIDYTTSSAANLGYKYVRSEGTDKLEMLFRLICFLGNEPSIIFCNHREAVNRISELLASKRIEHGIFHGGMEQDQREVSLIKFRNGTQYILLTTDLASRGLDVPEIKNVIHYQLPTTQTAWTHRNGRTARMDKDGTVWLVLAENDYFPEFIQDEIAEVKLPESLSLPPETPWETLYFGGGRKDKISKADIAGFLMQKGLLRKNELGRIEVLDYASFAAVTRTLAYEVVRNTRGDKLKNKKIKIDIAKGY